ncbi:MAG: monovalent cation:proton antiporter-2 (CPA2) family protein [Pseudobdellovibrionaceae bacterium]
MHSNDVTFYFLIFLVSAVCLVPIFQRLGLGSVLGYLAAGLLIGPYGLGLIKNPESIAESAEFGVVFLLFIIGLELQPQKILKMKNQLLGLGGVQVLACTVIFTALALLFKFSWPTSLVLGFALSLSSTAFSLQTLMERKVLNTEFGQGAFSVLLMQDVLAIPALAIIPSLGASSKLASSPQWLMALLLVVILIVCSRFLFSPLFRFIASLRNRELFTACTLCIVIGVAYAMHLVGLSMALGSFIAGVLLSSSEYRHELEADLSPFKGLLMGLFFISVGMSVNYYLLLQAPLLILGMTLIYILVKGGVLYLVAKANHFRHKASKDFMLYLVQGGEFAFVLFGVGLHSKLLSVETSQQLTLVITLSMILSPVILFLDDQWQVYKSKSTSTPKHDLLEAQNNPVIIAGFGRFGQIFGRLLKSQNVGFTAIDHDSEQIDLVRRFGNKVYYGDASREEILDLAGAKEAKYFILAIDDAETSVRVAEVVRKNYPHLKVFARARNRQHVFSLLDLGITHIKRETFDSSLNLTGELLKDMGYDDKRVADMLVRFKTHDELMLLEQSKVRHNEKSFIDISRQGADQLAQVLQEDAEKTYIR